MIPAGTFMAGGRQWRLHCYPTGMNDHQWMDVPDGITVVLIPVHKCQMVRVSLLLYMNTHTHTWQYGRIILLLSSL
jgi:hypothetical protein